LISTTDTRIVRPADVKVSKVGKCERSKLGSFKHDVEDARSAAAAEAAALVRRCAEPRPAGESVKAAIRRASQRLDFSFMRTRGIWYSEARRIGAREMDRLREETLKTDFSVGIDALKRLASAQVPLSHPMFPELAAALRLLLNEIGRPDPGVDLP
jgi:hypothetical protein